MFINFYRLVSSNIAFLGCNSSPRQEAEIFVAELEDALNTNNTDEIAELREEFGSKNPRVQQLILELIRDKINNLLNNCRSSLGSFENKNGVSYRDKLSGFKNFYNSVSTQKINLPWPFID
jgi:hypothetical protein